MSRKFFLKRLKNYFTILMTPTLVLFLLFFCIMGNSQIRNLNTTSGNTLENMNETFDLITANSFYQQDLMTLNPQLSLSLRKILLFEATNYTDYVFLNSMKTILNSATKSHPFIQSIYLSLNQYDNFFSSDKGICSLYHYYDTSWYDIYRQLPEDTSNYITHRTIPANGSKKETEVMTFYQKMTYLDGVIVSNIPLEAFLGSMKSIFPIWENYFFILNTDHDILLSHTNAQNSSLNFADHFHKTGELSVENEWIVIDGRLFLKNAPSNQDYALTFLLLTPAGEVVRNTLNNLTWFLAVIMANCIFVFVLSLKTTRDNFSQIRYIIDLFDNAEKGIIPGDNSCPRTVENEYDLILNNVVRMFLNTTFLNSQLAEQRYKKQVVELAALQLQINPHFMVNTLQTLNFEVYKEVQKPTSVNKIINNLSDILKYSLMPAEIPVTIWDELNNIHKYVEIQKYRFPDCFLVYEDVDDAILQLPLKRLLLQPLVENSISHGIRPASRFGYVKIRIFIRQQKIHVSIIDNGIGINRSELKKLRENLLKDIPTEGIGLDNVNKRLVLNYGPESCLRILSHQGLGTCISFTIPVS